MENTKTQTSQKPDKEQLEKVRAASQTNNLLNTVGQQVESKINGIKSKYLK